MKKAVRKQTAHESDRQGMNQKFDFDNIGRRMPYTMPPDTFDKMEAQVFAAWEKDAQRKRPLRILRWSAGAAVAVAASVALLLAVAPKATVPDNPLAQIDLAYARLDKADQDYLIDIYQDDIFLTQEPIQ